jgi:hypothetical protein
MIEHDVHDGRGHMNLSRWNEYSAEEKRGILSAMGAAVKNGVMPLPRYLHLHPEAKLSEAEIERIYQWTKSERRRLKLSGTPAISAPKVFYESLTIRE